MEKLDRASYDDSVDDGEREEIESILKFWFGELCGPHDVDTSKSRLWWMGGEAIDAEIRERFGQLVARARAGELEHWTETPRACLALVILLDQFTRNLGRGTADAFTGDHHAQRVVLLALERGHDQELRLLERSFLCMPLMHAEDRELARRSLEVFAQLSQEVAALGREGYPDFHSSAVTHAEIVERFGRYPHRNEILGREPTAAEQEYLAGGGPSFGQSKR